MCAAGVTLTTLATLAVPVAACMRCKSCCDVLHCCHTLVGLSKFFVYVVVWMPVQSNALLHHVPFFLSGSAPAALLQATQWQLRASWKVPEDSWDASCAQQV